MSEGEIRFKVHKQVDSILENLVSMGIFSTKNDVARMALIKLLDDMHLFDQLKNAIETHPIDK